MDDKIKKLRDFINTYAENYLDDGTKEYILEGLDKGDTQLALELLEAMDEEWINNVKESGIIRVFTDTRKVFSLNQNDLKPYYSTSYMDDYKSKLYKIPVLRYVISRQKTLPPKSNTKSFEER